MTYDSPESEPSDDRYEKLEYEALENLDHLMKTGDRMQTRRLSSVSKSLSIAQTIVEQESLANSPLVDISPTLSDHTLIKEMEAAVNVSSIRVAPRQNGIEHSCCSETTRY